MTHRTIMLLSLLLTSFIHSEADVTNDINKKEVHSIKSAKEFKELTKDFNMLVKFYAPWCGHCKALAPEYIKAAEQLNGHNLDNVILAEVDCTSDETKKVCSDHNVKGYPTLKYFSVGTKKPLDYTGERKTQGIISYVTKMAMEVIQFVTEQKALDDLIKENKIVVVEYSKDKPSKRFHQIAKKMRLDYIFATVNDEDLMKSHSAEHDDIILFRSFDEEKIRFDDKKRKLAEWIHHKSFPVLGEMDAQNYQKYFERKKPIFWIVVDKKDEKILQEIQSLTETFKPYRDSIHAIFIDGPAFSEPLNSMGFTDKYPNAMMINKDEKYQYDDDLTPDKVKKFFEKFNKKELPRFYRSAEVPEKNDGPIREVVGNTFEEVVLDEERDVVLEYYLSYCAHCKKFTPEYEKIAELFAENEHILIAKINGEHNDTPHKVEGYPTLMLFRSGRKNEPLKYEGDMKSEKIEKWIMENSPLLLEQKLKPEDLEKTVEGKKEL